MTNGDIVDDIHHPHADHHARDSDLRHLALVAFVCRVVVILPGRSFTR